MQPATQPPALARRLAAAAAVLLYLALGAAYASAVPPWEAPDEPWHAAYALAVADGRLPTVDETYEYHHPPLAYAWYALGIRIARIRSLPVGDANPHYPFAAAALAHPPGDPRVGRVRFLRTWGALLAALAVAITFAAARAVKVARAGGVAAAFVLAAWPQFVFTGHTVSNDGLATMAGATLLYSVVRLLAGADDRRAGGPRTRRAAATAFVGAAVAVATKLNAAVLVPVVVVAALAVVVTARDPRRRAAGAWTAIGAVAGSIGSLVVLGVVAPGAIAALAAQALARTGGRAASLSPAFVADTLASLWARFGWANVDLPPVLLVPVGIVAGVVVVVGLPLAIGRRRRGDGPVSVSPLIGAVAIVAASVIAFGASALADPQPQGRLLVPGLPALVVVLVAGWAVLRKGGLRRVVTGVAVLGVVGSHVGMLGIVLPRAYRPAAMGAGITAERHLPVPWRVVATVRGGAPATQPIVVGQAGFRRVDLPVFVQSPGTLTLRLTRDDSGGAGSEGRDAGEARVVGEATMRVERTRPRPWYGEARARPEWVSVAVGAAMAMGSEPESDSESVSEMEASAEGARQTGPRQGESLLLTVEASDGALVSLWGGDAAGEAALRGDAVARGGGARILWVGWFGR